MHSRHARERRKIRAAQLVDARRATGADVESRDRCGRRKSRPDVFRPGSGGRGLSVRKNRMQIVSASLFFIVISHLPRRSDALAPDICIVRCRLCNAAGHDGLRGADLRGEAIFTLSGG